METLFVALNAYIVHFHNMKRIDMLIIDIFLLIKEYIKYPMNLASLIVSF